MKNRRFFYVTHAIQYTLLILFIGSYFGLNIPLDTLIDTLVKNLVSALPLGAMLAYFHVRQKVLNR